MKNKPYMALTRHATNAIIVTGAYSADDPGTPRIVYVNDQYLKMTGYSLDEVIGKTPRFLHGPDTDGTQLREALINGVPAQVEIINYNKDGEAFWSSVSIFPIMNGEDKPEYWFGIKSDISKYKTALDEHFVNNELYEAAFQAINDTIWDLDIQKDIIRFNDRYFSMFGYSNNVMNKASELWKVMVHPDDHDRVMKRFINAVLSGNKRVETEYRYRCADGSYKNIFDRAVIISDNNNNPVRIIGIMQDITPIFARDSRAKQLKDVVFNIATNQTMTSGDNLEDGLRGIIQTSANALQVERANIWTVNNGHITCIASFESGGLNALAGTELNLKKSCPAYYEEITNNRVVTVGDAIHDSRTKELADDYLIPNNIFSMLDVPVINSGSVVALVCFEYTGSRHEWSSDEVTFANDIGDLIAVILANAETRKREQELVQSLQEKEVLLQEVHHRVKNNLAVISAMLNLQLLDEENTGVSEKLLASTMRIQTMASIHEQLYRSGNYSFMDVEEFLKKLVTGAQEVFKSETQIEVFYTLDKVKLNLNQSVPLSLIVNEVLINIFKHAFEGRASGKIHIHLSGFNDKIRLIIKDNGRGLPKEFNREKESTLGLKIISTLTDQLKGRFKLFNSDEYTVFELSFLKTHSLNGTTSKTEAGFLLPKVSA